MPDHPSHDFARSALVNRRTVLFASAAAAAGLALSGSRAEAAGYPSEITTIISPFAAGGINDFMARAVGQKLQTAFGKSVIVENQTGANGQVGAGAVARAKGDPYRLLMGNSATHGTNSTLYPDLSYDPEKDFSPIGMVSKAPIVMIVSASVPVKNVREFIEYAKKNKGALAFGSSGLGGFGHIAGEKFVQVTGLDIVHSPFRGDSPAVTDVLGNQVPVAFVTATSVIAHAKSDKLKILAVADKKRSPVLPDVPTFEEEGVKEMDFYTWYALMAPAGIPAEAVAKLSNALTEGLKSEEMRENFAKQGAEPIISTPQELAEFIKAEIIRCRKLITDLDIKVQ